MVKLMLRVLATGTIVLTGSQAMAQTPRVATTNFQVKLTLEDACEVSSVQDMDFGAPTVNLEKPVYAEGMLNVECTGNVNVTLKLNGGQSNDVNNRTMSMSGGASRVKYQLYQDKERLKVWGDTEASSIKIAGVATTTQPIYGTVFEKSAQAANLSAGTYTDTISVALEY